MQIYALLTKCEVLKMAGYKCICQVFFSYVIYGPRQTGVYNLKFPRETGAT